MLEKHKETVKALNAVISANDLEQFLSFYTDDVRWSKDGDQSATGTENLRQLILSLGDAPPPATVTFEALVGEGDTVAAYGTLTVRVPDGETSVQQFCDVYRFRGEQIFEHTAFGITPSDRGAPGKQP
jgi:uncharacterized protein